jgi:hypothetical protein
MRIHPAFLFAMAVNVLVPSLASAEDEHGTHGVTPTEVYRPEHMAPNKVVRISILQTWTYILRAAHPAVSAFPERVVGSACASSFSRIVHSRYGLHTRAVTYS